ncbi:hypothetical protein ACFS5M_06170 [Lacinutrix iliipiscaria]|uniref:Uncharacterized protein n=1 Tax=Lacinutrix iliipiscaria TaxID=1230532 RepID=A0ABW5WLV4_9FLAO
MSQDYNNPAFKKLLSKLQEESWQLELLISGFAIFGLFTAFPAISESVLESKNTQQMYKFVISIVAQISCAILIFNLLLHVLLRGLWIGALGLRYVSGDIEYDELNYSAKFTNYLKKKVGSFDKYIGTLENYCSIIFAISFLLIFYVLAITFTIIAIGLIGNFIIGNEDLPTWLSKGVGITLMIFIILGMLISFIDFVTQGFLKKKKWLSKLYFPVYWVFGFITLSFLYRPLVYNFLDNKFGRRLSFTLVPIYFIILLMTSVRYNYSNYLSETASSNDFISNNDNYEDLVEVNNGLIEDVVIQSKIITDPFIKIFVAFNDNIEDRIFDFNPDLEPEKDKRGLLSDITFSNKMVSTNKRDSLRREYLKTFNAIYKINIDTLSFDSNFIISKSKKGNLGFETYISTKRLLEGKHLLEINRLIVEKNDTTTREVSKIPFWYYLD